MRAASFLSFPQITQIGTQISQIIKLSNGFVPTSFSTSTTASRLLPSQASQNPRNLRTNLRNLREIRDSQIIKLPNGFVPTAFSISTTASRLLPSQASQNPRN
ncbi:MAG TPA: hypothetical protein PLO35_02930, partial [Candidatus Cloacimonadota bacterium]|nr:hypothetical protein [Candidatus Cloacimonadota bacterium]